MAIAAPPGSTLPSDAGGPHGDAAGRSSRGARAGGHTPRARRRRRPSDVLFILPMLVLLSAVILVPTAMAVVGSFRDWQPGYDSPFIGWANYADVLASPVTREIAVNQLVFALGVPLWVLVPLVVAVLLWERVPAPGVFRAIFFFPAVLSPVTVGLMYRGLLGPEGGLNGLLRGVGLDALAQGWLTDPAWVKPTLILVVLWYTLGFGVVLYSAALSGLSPELIEAALLDGAGWLQRLWHVVLPAILPTVMLNTIFSTATIFLLFGYVKVLTQGGPGYASTTIDYDIHQNSMVYGYFGYAAAESVLLLVVMAIVIGSLIAVARRTWR